MSRPPAPTIKQTVQGRLKDIRQLAADFNTHLTTQPGSVLSPNVRLGIALCARDAHSQCKACHADAVERRSSMVCPMPNVRNYGIMGDMRHEPGFPTAPTEKGTGISSAIATCLITIIHTLICHQDKIDVLLYNDAIADLQSCGILNDYASAVCDFDEIDLAARVAYCEIILVASLSHGLNVTFQSLGLEVPPLPTWDDIDRAPSPMNLRYTKLLRNGAFTTNPSFAYAPYLPLSDLNKESLEYKQIPSDVWTALPKAPVPFRCANLAVLDFAFFFQSYVPTLYLSLKEMLLVWNELDATKKCSAVTRFDLEVAAGATAAAHRCVY